MSMTILPVTGNGSAGVAGGASAGGGVVGKGTAGSGAPAGPVPPPSTPPVSPASDPTAIVDAGLYSGTNESYAEVIDQRTHEVVRMIPPETILQFFAGIDKETGKQVDLKT